MKVDRSPSNDNSKKEAIYKIINDDSLDSIKVVCGMKKYLLIRYFVQYQKGEQS